MVGLESAHLKAMKKTVEFTESERKELSLHDITMTAYWNGTVDLL